MLFRSKHYESSKEEINDVSKNELANDWINNIFCDNEGLIWLAHYKGVSCFNPENESFINYNNSNLIIEGRVGYALNEDYMGNIWAGTTDGFFCFKKKDPELFHFSVKDGLPNNVICGISEDSKLIIWVSTSLGISKYIPSEDRFVNYSYGSC